ncbi:MAG: hypothetical protein K8R90_06080 [Candidatus Cloacimonetes bacterium]|nr:hypothetical protein [Candidatus Cloacimonadota bacterium]
MNILIVSNRNDLYDEWEDFAVTLDSRVFFATDRKQAVSLLECEHIDVAVLDVRAMSDLGLLKYINDTHTKVRVMLVTQERMSDLVAVARDGHYSLVGDNLDIASLLHLIAEAGMEGK